MVVRNQIKLIKSLQQKKYRNQHALFVVEGKKAVASFLSSDYKTENVYCTEEGIFDTNIPELEVISKKEMSQMSGQKNRLSGLGFST